MNSIRRTPLVAALATLAFAACSVDRGVGSAPDPAGPLSVTPSVDTALLTDTVRFTTHGLPTTAGPVSWTVSDSRVATIAQQGDSWALIRALHQGTTTVSAATESQSASGVLVVDTAELAFVGQPSNGQPSTTWANHAFTSLQVAVRDAQGNVVTSATDSVTVAIGTNPGSGMLSGTVTVAAANGIATFADLSVTAPGQGYTLTATSQGRKSATSAPFTIAALAALSVGSFHACGVTTAGAAYCWGDVWADLTTNGGPVATVPTAVATGLTFRAVSSGEFHSCGLTTAGAVFCWGGSGYVPVAGLVPGGITFAAVSAGESHDCAVTPAGAAYCWGNNGYGELGDGSTANSTVPVAVAGGLTFATVSAGSQFTCGVTLAGAAYCWGFNFAGQLGTGSSLNSPTPAPVVGGLTFTTLSAGLNHACGVTTAGAAYCWGQNDSGQLGIDSVSASNAPVPVVGGLSFRMVSASWSQTCGVTPAGAGYCWGAFFGGASSPSTLPVAVPGGLTFRSLGAGAYHTCGVTPTGVAYCLGNNYHGQLGNGSTIAGIYTPVPVANP